MTPKFCIYYQVYLNDTAVTRVSANNFQPQGLLIKPDADQAVRTKLSPIYALPPLAAMFYGYASQTEAMEQAKVGAIRHINSLIAKAEDSIQDLKSYRMAHHTDLNVTLLDANIRRLEKELNIK